VTTTAPPRTRELRAGILARYATGEFVTSGFAALPGLVLVFYMTDSLAVPALLAGAVVTIAKIWDIIIDPIVGAYSDREFAARGSRRRLMLLGAVVLPLFFVVTFAVPPGTEPLLAALWVFVAFLLAATGFSFFQVPYNVLPAELVSSYDARTRLLSARVLVLTAAILLYGGGGPALRETGVELFGTDFGGYLFMAVGAAVIFIVAILVTSTVERAARGKNLMPPPPASRAFTEFETPRDSIAVQARRGTAMLRSSKPFRTLLATFFVQSLAAGGMLAGTQYVATWVLGDTEAVTILFVALILPAIISTPLWGVVARRIGKERAYVIATSIFFLAALSLTGLLVVPDYWIVVPIGFVGVAFAGIQALALSMLPDVIAHDARANGPGRGGSFSGIWTAGETTGLAFGTTILAVILAVSGYLESSAATAVEAQPTSAVFGIVMSFSVVPAVLMALSYIPLFRYPLRKKDIDLAPDEMPAPPASAPRASE
jgi:glycoside/pentoside/hexuronide:cation symporter, GPH family